MTPFERWSVRVTALLVTVTGLAYGWMKYVLSPAQPWDAVNHPLQPLVLKLHILTAPLLVFALGMIAVRHVWRHLREPERAGRRTGWIALIAAVAMIVTGYLIQAVTHQRWLFGLAMAHVATGVGFAGAVALHQVNAPRGTLRGGSSRTTDKPESPAPGPRSRPRPRSPTG